MPSTLETNLARLRTTEPELAARLAATTPVDLQITTARSGEVTGTVAFAGKPLSLASRYDPGQEARKLLEEVDLQKHACVVLLGMGLGHHVGELLRRMPPTGIPALVILFEPNTALLRAVFEKIDLPWLNRANLVIVDGATDRPSLLRRVEKHGGLMTQGTVLVTHPPTRHMAGEAVAAFGRTVTEVLAFCRTNIATTLVNSTRSIRNLASNIGHYAGGATTDALHRAAEGCLGVCVGAGPSLAGNIDLLTRPEVRNRLVLISAQTTLKPLLQRGIEPDFVTALDYHEISSRFYEGLDDLPMVTLVADPLANSTILERFPGPVRLTRSGFLDHLLDGIVPPRIGIPPGATVAHLSFYLAQHLGCDPIVLVGQDLGFSNGLYYCPGTAIHDVWDAELGPFNTLEMLEWKRIVRHRNHLQKLPDIHGQPIYSDEQMITYLRQFERDFAKAPETVIDATEGGLPKQHTTRMSLEEAVQHHAKRQPRRTPTPALRLDADKIHAARRRVEEHLERITELRRHASATNKILQKMLKHHRDKTKFDQLFQRLVPLRRRVQAMEDTFETINQLNAIGSFKRARADREIQMSSNDPSRRQRRQIERDMENMDFIVQACTEAVNIFQDAIKRLGTSQDGTDSQGKKTSRAA